MPAGPKRIIPSEKLPEYARHIRSLRGSDLQGAFARKMGVSPMAVSHWETGSHEPSTATYIKLAALAEGEAERFFLDQARARSQLTQEGMAALASAPPARGVIKKGAARHAKTVNLPLWSAVAGCGAGRLTDPETIEMHLAVPRHLCPNPERTGCVRVRGDSMWPTISDGSVVAVDRSECNAERLVGKVVAARHDDEGLVVKRLQKGPTVTVLASDNPGHPPLSIANGWEIVGKAIWWIQHAEGR